MFINAHAQSQCGLLKLPQEVLNTISTYLDIDEQIFFALSCKLAASRVGPRRYFAQALDHSGRSLKFLKKLAPIMPDKLVLCPICIKYISPPDASSEVGLNWERWGHRVFPPGTEGCQHGYVYICPRHRRSRMYISSCLNDLFCGGSRWRHWWKRNE